MTHREQALQIFRGFIEMTPELKNYEFELDDGKLTLLELLTHIHDNTCEGYENSLADLNKSLDSANASLAMLKDFILKTTPNWHKGQALLLELSLLKDYKDEKGKDEFYAKRKSEVWEEARKIIDEYGELKEKYAGKNT